MIVCGIFGSQQYLFFRYSLIFSTPINGLALVHTTCMPVADPLSQIKALKKLNQYEENFFCGNEMTISSLMGCVTMVAFSSRRELVKGRELGV